MDIYMKSKWHRIQGQKVKQHPGKPVHQHSLVTTFGENYVGNYGKNVPDVGPIEEMDSTNVKDSIWEQRERCPNGGGKDEHQGFELEMRSVDVV